MAGTITSYNGSTQIWNLNDNAIDTSGLVQLEIQVLETKKTPLTTIQTRLSNEQTVYQAFKDDFDSFVTFMDEMQSFEGSDKTASLSDTGYLTATADADAVSGTYEVSITQLATRHQISGNAITASNIIGTAGTIQINGKDLEVTASMTYQELMNKVNSGSYGATMYTVGGRLFMASTTMGADGAITLTDSNSILESKLGLWDSTTNDFTSEITAAQNAKYSINGTDELESATNTIDNAVPGVTLKLTKETTAGSPVTVTIEDSESDEAIEKIKSMIDYFNNAADTLASYTAEGTNMQASSIALVTGRAMDNMAMFNLNGNYLYQYGIQVDKTGQLDIDETKLKEAFDADPEAAKAFFFGTSGIASTMNKELSNIFGDSGIIQTKLDSLDDQLDDIDEELDAIDAENELKQESIVEKYALFEQQMSALNSQLDYIKALTGSDDDDD